MKISKIPSGTRRQLFRAMVAGLAGAPFIAFPKKSASQAVSSARRRPVSCLLKGTKIATPLGDRPVQDLKIGEEVSTVAGPKKIKWIGYNKFTKEKRQNFARERNADPCGPLCV